MCKTDKPFKTVDEQIEILKSRNLRLLAEDSAKAALSNYGYYEIINGYKDEFISDTTSFNKENFSEGSIFEHIFAMYQLDKDIRNALRWSLENFEQTLKQSIAYIVSKDISELQTEYTQSKYYNAGESHKWIDQYGKEHSQTDRDTLLNKNFKKILSSDFEPYKHYRERHGNIPPWILVKGLSFGSSIYFFTLLKSQFRINIISRMIGLEPSLISQFNQELKITESFSDILILYLDYRNTASHCGRVYNHRSKKHEIRNYSPFIYKRDEILNISRKQFNNEIFRSSVGTVVQTLNIFQNKDSYLYLVANLTVILEKYLENYPDDLEFLLNKMELHHTTIEHELKKQC